MTTNNYFYLEEFAYGLRFELYYWLEDYAFCLNLAHFIEPVTIKFQTEQTVVECSKTLISCFDDWSMWLDEEAQYIECSQSSGSTVTLYQYLPITEDEDSYLLGNSTYLENYCWPGFSPFYSYFYQYPTNFQYAVVHIFTALKTLITSVMSVPGPTYEEQPERTFMGLDYMTLAYWLGDSFIKGLEY
jgi:hypothetical protein